MSEILGTLFKYLVSLLGVTAIVLILYQVMSSNKTQVVITDLTQLVSNIQSLYSGQASFGTLTTTVAINGKLAPTDMIAGSSTQLSNPWGPGVGVAGAGTQFTVTETLVPPDACAKILATIPGMLAATAPGGAVALPIDAGAAVAACGSAPGTMTLTFGH